MSITTLINELTKCYKKKKKISLAQRHRIKFYCYVGLRLGYASNQNLMPLITKINPTKETFYIR